MKKKLLAFLTALVCALTCASVLVGCSNEEKKAHNETQWKAAFNSALSARTYEIKQKPLMRYEDEETGQTHEFYSTVSITKLDIANRLYYAYNAWSPEFTNTEYLMKKGDRYYLAFSQAGFAARRLTEAEFGEREQEDFVGEYGTIIETLLKKYRDSYGSFKAAGSGSNSWSRSDDEGNVIESHEVSYTNYAWQNTSVTLGEGEDAMTYSVESVKVSIDTEGALYGVTLTGILPPADATEGDDETEEEPTKMEFEITFDPDVQRAINDGHILYPEALGHSFEYTDVLGPEGPTLSSLVEACRYKKITVAANGAISGDVQLGGADISTFTLTETDETITVSNGTITLTGTLEIKSGRIVITLTTEINGDTYTFILNGVD